MTEKMVKMYSTVYDLPTPSENRKREKKTVGIQTGLDNELFFFLTKKSLFEFIIQAYIRI